MKQHQKRAVAYKWLAILLVPVMVLLGGCGGHAGTQDSVGLEQSSQNSSQPSQVDKAYLVFGTGHINNNYESQQAIMTPSGKELIPMCGDELTIIQDSLTGEQLFIQRAVLQSVKMVEEEWGNYAEGEYQYLWYDMDGNPIDNPENSRINQVMGALQRENYNLVRNRKTGEVLLEGNMSWLEQCGNKIITEDQNKNVLAYNSDGTLAWKQQGSVYGIKDDLIALHMETEDENHSIVIINSDGQQILPGGYGDIRLEDTPGIVVVQDESSIKVYKVNDTTETPAYEMANTYVNRYGGYVTDDMISGIAWADEDAVAIVRDDANYYGQIMQLFNYAGEPIGEEYHRISTYDTLKGYYLGFRYSETGDTTSELFDANGNILLHDVSYDLQQIAENRIIKDASVQDLEGNVLTKREYYYVYPMYSVKKGDVPLLTAAYEYNNTILTDLLDLDGNVLISHLRYVNYLDDNLLWVEKGFYNGFMDYQGNWLYKQKLFRGDE